MSTAFPRGITVVEVVIAIAIFSIISSVAYASYLNANALSERASMKSDALWLAEEGIEATRSIRDQSFTNLTAGTKGLSRTANVWQFSGTSDVTDGFARSITLASGGTDIVFATSTVSWSQNNATSSVVLASMLTNWRRVPDTVANHATINVSSACVYTLDPRYMSNVIVTYDGTAGTVSVTQVAVSWTPTTPTRLLNQVLAPYPTAVWTGSAASAATSTLSTPVSFTAAGSQTFSFRWDASVSGRSFVVTFAFGDGSTKSATITSPLISLCL